MGLLIFYIELFFSSASTRRATRKAAAVKKDKKPVFTMATVTPLVSHIFDAIFKDQIADEMKAAANERKKRCGVCEVRPFKSSLFIFQFPMHLSWLLSISCGPV